jgi:uncharacterized membrane protein YgcG
MAAAAEHAAMTVLQLYRHILRAAKEFPSVKRSTIIREIKAEFRANKDVADPDKLAHCRQLAERGLSDLNAYRSGGSGGGGSGGGGEASITLKGATG